MIDRYRIIYDFSDEHYETCNIMEDFEGTWSELQDYLKQMRKNGCYNIDCEYLYSFEERLFG